MKITIWMTNNLVGCEVTEDIEIDDEDLEGLCDDDRSQYITDVCEQEMTQMYEWGWRESN